MAELLAFFGVDEDLLQQFVDHRPLHADESEALTRVLYALPKLPPEEVARWIENQPNWNAIIAAPQDYRLQIFHLAGRVERVARVELSPKVAERFEFTHYYLADVKLGHEQTSAVVCVRHIPQAWRIGEPIDERVSFDGMFLKLGDQPVFAASRLAWHPDKVDTAAGVTEDHLFLGDLQMDVGLWDDVVDKQSLLGEDREAFYQLLAAVGRTKPANLEEQSTTEFDFADLLRTPEAFHGRLLTVEGTARRAAKIIVSDDIRERFGIDHYYEVYVFIRLAKNIVFTQGDKQIEFNTFPVACCVRQLPPGMEEGDDIREHVRISGAFFKLWLYESPQMTSFDPQQLQPSPLLIGLEPQLVADGVAPNEYFGVIIGGLFVLGLFGAWMFVWRQKRRDTEFARRTIQRKYELEKGQSLNKLDLEAKGNPDFHHLE